MRYAAMAQQVERHLGKVEVTGSIPVGSFKVVDNLLFQNMKAPIEGAFYKFSEIYIRNIECKG